MVKKSDTDRRRVLGRSRGGLNTKAHAAVDAAGSLAEMQLSPRQDGDGPHGRELLEQFEPDGIEHVLGDATDNGDETRAVIKKLKAKACIERSKNRKKTL